MIEDVGRREFLLSSIGLAAMQPLRAQDESTVSPKGSGQTVGIQVGAVSFVDEGVPVVCEKLQKLGAVNTLFLAVFTYGRGIAGRQVPGQPLPDHGKQEYDLNFHGGNYGLVHPQYYRETGIRPEDTRAPDHGDLDIIAAVLPEAKRRGMKTVLWTEDVWRNDLPGIEKLQEIDLHGRPRRQLCMNNPYHRNFLLGLFEDYARSYEIDGIMWGSERQGALGDALGSNHGGSADPSRVGCFCRYCEAKAKKLGYIDFGRVKEGYARLQEYVNNIETGIRPVDGYHVTFLRTAMKYPEILAWEQFWHDSLREVYEAIYRKVKSVRPELVVGWHIWHNNSFSPFYRAQQDLQELSKYSDFLKMVMYHNCGGERMAQYCRNVANTLYGDLDAQSLLNFEYGIMKYRERPLGEIASAGFSADYVARETRRAIDGAAGTKTLILPGIDIDIPTASGHSKSTPEGTKAAVLAAFRNGAHGVILSRKYSEMRLANLGGAGDGIRETGKA